MPKLYSHDSPEQRTEFEKALDSLRERIVSEGDTEFATASEKLATLGELSQFELGRFLIVNRGIDGIWNHYIAYEFPRLPEAKKPKRPMERMLIEIMGDIELRPRLELVWKLLKSELRDGVSLLSVPCGVMADLSALDYSGISDFQICGADLDPNVLKRAAEFNRELGLQEHTQLICKDAWNLGMENSFDVVVSMGLSPYVSDSKKLLDLYSSLRNTLKRGGKLFLSYITPYPFRDPNTERDLSSLDPVALRLQRLVISEIVKTRVVNFNSTSQILDQLKSVGFSKVDIHYTTCKSPNIAVATR